MPARVKFQRNIVPMFYRRLGATRVPRIGYTTVVLGRVGRRSIRNSAARVGQQLIIHLVHLNREKKSNLLIKCAHAAIGGARIVGAAGFGG